MLCNRFCINGDSFSVLTGLFVTLTKQKGSRNKRVDAPQVDVFLVSKLNDPALESYIDCLVRTFPAVHSAWIYSYLSCKLVLSHAKVMP